MYLVCPHQPKVCKLHLFSVVVVLYSQACIYIEQRRIAECSGQFSHGHKVSMLPVSIAMLSFQSSLSSPKWASPSCYVPAQDSVALWKALITWIT